MIMLQIFASLLSLASGQNQEEFSLAVTIPGVPGKFQFRLLYCGPFCSFRRGLSDFF